MKLEMDLVRTILLELEKMTTPKLNNIDDLIPELSEEIKNYHLVRMEEGNLVSFNRRNFNTDAFMLYNIEITWDGHQLLDQIREEKFWNKLKSKLIKSGVGISIFALKIGAPKLIEEILK